MKSDTIHPFKRVRAAGVPIVSWETPDPAATIAGCTKAMNGKAAGVPILVWDCVRGCTLPNVEGLDVTRGRDYIASIPEEIKGGWQSLPVILPYLCGSLPMGETPEGGDRAPGGVVFLLNGPRFWEDVVTMQAVWNCRDVFKSAGVTLCLIGPGAKLPAELRNDVPSFEEPVPDEADIAGIIDSITHDAGVTVSEEQKPKVIDGLLGYLSAFRVEQALSLSITKEGVDLDQLWRLKVAGLKETAGLEVSLPKFGFDSLVGCDGVKALLRDYLKGKKAPRVILWLDEIEKMLAGGSGGDLSGTTQALLEQFLYWTESRQVDGCLLLGIPGAGKSLTCQAVAGEAHIPLIRASLSTVKGGIVGQSEQQMSTLLKSVDAVGQGRILLLSTCNGLDALTPEVMARHRLATFFYDYPTEAEKQACFRYYVDKFKLTEKQASPLPPSRNWVGREIASCCERAWLFDKTLTEAAKSVVPVSVASASKMDTLRRSVSGRFLSAAHPGIFDTETAQAPAMGRKVEGL